MGINIYTYNAMETDANGKIRGWVLLPILSFLKLWYILRWYTFHF